ncbi:MAG: RNA polymerase sigma factor [Odoribacter splanchnicus]
MEGLSYRDIAKTLQVTEEQVKVNLFRARKKIKTWILNMENYGL